MTTDNLKPQVRSFVASWLPWVLGAVMLVIYLATLNTALTPGIWRSFAELAQWRPGGETFGPLAFILTYPLRWLPHSALPFALNVVAAICAVLILILLARSVALLPRDRTHGQRRREQHEFSILSIPAAWVPPLFAVIACGLELSFWNNAVEYTGDLFTTLFFAYSIRCLLEYRIDQRNSWLFQFALVYGLGMANDWAFMGFFPAFLVALVWIKGASFFRLRFLGAMLLWGLIGLSFIFLIPLVDTLSHAATHGFWHELLEIFKGDKLVLTRFPRDVVLLLGLTSLLPILFIAIRWPSYFGDNSPTGIMAANITLHIFHGVILVACLWVAFDAPISPRHKGLGFSFLTFYYLGALTIGYCAGYFLLIFGTPVSRSHSRREPLEKMFDVLLTGAVWLLLVATPVILIGRNLPYLRAEKKTAKKYDAYASDLAQLLPPRAVVVCDDPFRLTYLEAALERENKKSSYLFVDTAFLEKDFNYLGFLQKSNPSFQVSDSLTNVPPGGSHDLGTLEMLDKLSQKYDTYYLQASFGYFFEHFSLRQAGLVYQLKPYATNVWDAPLPTAQDITFNQQYWKQTFAQDLEPMIPLLNTPEVPAHPGSWDKFMAELHLKPEHSFLLYPLAAYYSQALNHWGVELQRANLLPEASACFIQSGQLNGLNVSSLVNNYVNEILRQGKEPGVRPPKDLEERINARGGWQEILRSYGPVDEPNFRDDLATAFIGGGNYRQAVQQYHRILQMSPSSLGVKLQLAQLLIFIQTYTNATTFLLPYQSSQNEALALVKNILEKAPTQPMALFLDSVILMQNKEYKQAIQPLNQLLTVETNNYAAFLNRAIAHYKLDNLAAAKVDYEVVAKNVPQAFQAYYGLGEIAYRQKDMPTAITNYQLYLTNSPPNTEEAKTITVRLKELKAGAP